jgi:cell wall-associated NlpC family hydrolase
MLIRAVGKRCGVVLQDLGLPVSDGHALEDLTRAGFKVVPVSLVELARSRIGVSTFARKAQVREAPNKVDCSSFIKWLYGQLGVWIPRRTIQQWLFGQPVELAQVAAGDLVFTRGLHTYYTDDYGHEVGHVGLATGQDTVVHAANSQSGVTESPMQAFCKRPGLTGVRRVVPLDRVVTLEVPDHREVETSDDLRWMLLSSQTRKK